MDQMFQVPALLKKLREEWAKKKKKEEEIKASNRLR